MLFVAFWWKGAEWKWMSTQYKAPDAGIHGSMHGIRQAALEGYTKLMSHPPVTVLTNHEECEHMGHTPNSLT